MLVSTCVFTSTSVTSFSQNLCFSFSEILHNKRNLEKKKWQVRLFQNKNLFALNMGEKASKVEPIILHKVVHSKWLQKGPRMGHSKWPPKRPRMKPERFVVRKRFYQLAFSSIYILKMYIFWIKKHCQI